MRIKYNRVSTLNQTGQRYSLDKETYDLVYMDRVSGKIPFSEREYGSKIVSLVKDGLVDELVIEEISRIGRSMGDSISTLEFLDSHKVNIVVRNLGLQSRPNGKPNPVWKIMSSVMSSLYDMELENIRERTKTGIEVYLSQGGVLGRPKFTNESKSQFLKKEKPQQIIKLLDRGLRYSEIQKIVGCSPNLIRKVKRIIQESVGNSEELTTIV